MNITQKLKDLFSPYDIVSLTKEYSFLCEKTKTVDIPQELLQDAKTFLGVGPCKEKNPTWFIVFGNTKIEIDDQKWEKGISNLYRLICKPEITEIDNETNHVKIDASFVLLTINAIEIPQQLYRGLKCVQVKTAMGEFLLDDQL